MVEWKPNRKQEKFLALPDSIKEAFYGGGAGSGKSDVLMMYAIARQWVNNPKFKQLFMRRTYPELKREIIPRSREIYTAFGGHYNKSDMVWDFPSGAMIWFGHCENESDVHKYDTMEINLFTPDELTSFTEYQYLYIAFTRVRTSAKDLPAITRAAGMPGGVGHTFVRRRFVDPFKTGGKVIIGKGGNKRIFIFATLVDNPHIDQGYSQSLEALPDAEKNAKKYGSFDAYEGQVFEEFREHHYPDEPDNALHVVTPFEIPDWWPRILVIDWGFSAMTWAGYGAISPSKRLIIYREQHWKKVKITEWAPYVRENLDREDVKVIKVCKSAAQDRGQEHTVQQQIEEALGRGVELTNNNSGSRIAGKMLIHEYLRWKAKYVPTTQTKEYDETVAQWTLRNYGELAYRNYLAQYNPPSEENNIPKLLIFNTCQVLVNAIKSCVYDKNNVEDIAQFEGDDPVDGLRYLVDTADRFFSEAEFEFQKVEKRQELVDEFAATQDWNKLFRRAIAIEAVEKTTTQSIRRFRGGIHVPS